MWGSMLVFARIMLKDGLALQIAVFSAATVLVLNGVNRSTRSVLFYILRTAGLTAALFITYMICGGIFMYIRSNASLWLSVFLFLCVSLYAGFFCKYDWRVKLLVCSEMLASYVTLTELGGAFGRVVETLWEWESWVIRSLSICMIIVLALLMRRFHIGRFDEIPVRGAIFTFALNVLCVWIVQLGQLMSSVAFNFPVYITVTHLLLYAIEILLYFMFYAICDERADRMQQQKEKELIAANRELIEISEKTFSDMRQLRHDMKNHLACMTLMIENGDLVSLKNYFADLMKEMNPSLTFIDCGNKNISAILNVKKAKAKAQGYTLESDIIIPEEMPFQDTDMCSILSNILDNAVEAMDKYGFSGGSIWLRMRCNGDYLCITVRNPLPPDADSEKILRLFTTKSDKSLHGLGTKIVKKLAAKYNGVEVFDITE